MIIKCIFRTVWLILKLFIKVICFIPTAAVLVVLAPFYFIFKYLSFVSVIFRPLIFMTLIYVAFISKFNEIFLPNGNCITGTKFLIENFSVFGFECVFSTFLSSFRNMVIIIAIFSILFAIILMINNFIKKIYEPFIDLAKFLIAF